MFYQGYREHVPGVFRENVSDQEVNLVGGVQAVAISCGPQAIVRACRRDTPHGLYLDAPKDFASADNDVVTIGVSPRFGDGESKSCGFSHESEFGDVSAVLTVKLSGMQKFILKSFFG